MPANPIIEPTDTSMPRVMMTIIWPIATTVSSGIHSSTLRRLDALKKRG